MTDAQEQDLPEAGSDIPIAVVVDADWVQASIVVREAYLNFPDDQDESGDERIPAAPMMRRLLQQKMKHAVKGAWRTMT